MFSRRFGADVDKMKVDEEQSFLDGQYILLSRYQSEKKAVTTFTLVTTTVTKKLKESHSIYEVMPSIRKLKSPNILKCGTEMHEYTEMEFNEWKNSLDCRILKQLESISHSQIKKDKKTQFE